LLDQNGEPFTLSRSIKQRKVWHLIYFYPCEAAGGQQFAQLGATAPAVGASVD